jgi:hypothetical protein
VAFIVYAAQYFESCGARAREEKERDVKIVMAQRKRFLGKTRSEPEVLTYLCGWLEGTYHVYGSTLIPARFRLRRPEWKYCS